MWSCQAEEGSCSSRTIHLSSSTRRLLLYSAPWRRRKTPLSSRTPACGNQGRSRALKGLLPPGMGLWHGQVPRGGRMLSRPLVPATLDTSVPCAVRPSSTPSPRPLAPNSLVPSHRTCSSGGHRRTPGSSAASALRFPRGRGGCTAEGLRPAQPQGPCHQRSPQFRHRAPPGVRGWQRDGTLPAAGCSPFLPAPREQPSSSRP